MRWLIRLIWLAGAATILATLFLTLRAAPIEVETATVMRGHFEETVQQDGKTRVRSRYIVAAPLAGTLRRIALKSGDPVQAGELVAEILPHRAPLLDQRTRQEAEHRLGAAEAAAARASAAAAQAAAAELQASSDAQRTRALAANAAVPKSRLEHDELALVTAQRAREAADQAGHAAAHDVEAARAAMRDENETREPDAAPWKVRAPVAGRVLRVLQESETPIANGAPMLEIGDPTDLEVVADLLTEDAVLVHPGDVVRIAKWGGPDPLAGRVRRVEPGAFTKVSALGVDEQRTNVVVDLLTPPAQRPTLGDAFRVDVRIVIAAQDNALVVPAGALLRDREGWSVFVVENGRAYRRTVTLAARSGTAAAAAGGLRAGEAVVLFPGDTLTDGARVRSVAERS